MMTQDLITEILLKLPVKSIIRCKSVCKPWLSLISSPDFIDSHIKHTLTNSDGADQTVIVYENDDNSMSLLNLSSREIEPPLPLGLPFSRGEYASNRAYKIVGSCNGIVCVSVTNSGKVSDSKGNLMSLLNDLCINPNTYNYLWNPATKQSKLVPPHNIPDYSSEALGFGFDPMSNDFKVVSAVTLCTLFLELYPCHKHYSAEVYSTNTNVWREVDPGLTNFGEYKEFNVCVNGFLCCAGSRGMMAVFDLDKEVFTCGINLPDTSSSHCVTDFNDCIAVITTMGGETNRIIQLWTLDNEACLRGGGVEASWTLVLSVDVDFPNPRVFGCFNCGDFVLYTDDDVCLLYNSYKEGRKVPDSIIIGHRIIRYTESLVSITGSKQVDWNAHEDDS